jgi:hypothetical protein
MTSHSAIVGGSTAARLLSCPGSYTATLALPPSADISSEYADEGTAMHEVMTRLMRIRQVTERKGYVFNPFTEVRKWIGDSRFTFHDRQLTQEHLDTMIEPALRHLAELETSLGGGASATGMPFEVLGVEARVAFPGIPGAFGTCDLILGNPDFVVHVDWKFGQGVGVKAVYRDGDGETVNAQLLFYCAAAKASIKGLYKGKRKPVLAIIQPRGDTPLSDVIISRKEIAWFVEDLQEAVIRATNRNPPRSKGEHCRFAPCKISCPLWTDAILDLTAIGSPPTRPVPATTPSPYGAYLARAKALVDVFAMYTKEVNDQLHSFLEDGGQVPGWRLKAKVKQRQWVDEDVVSVELQKLGFDWDEIWESKLVTFKAADATAKRRGVKIPDELRVAPPTTETTVCPTDDPAPVIERGDVVEAFRESLKLLAKG